MADDVTLGEVARRIDSVLTEVRDMRKDVIGRREYESDQEGIAVKFATAERALRDWKTTSTEANVDLGARISALAARTEKNEENQKANRQKWIFALVMALASPLAAFLVNLAMGNLR